LGHRRGRSSIQWLAATTNANKKTLSRQRRLGRSMRQLPVACRRVAGRQPDRRSCRVVGRRPKPAHRRRSGRRRGHAGAQAKSLWFRQFEQAIRYWLLVHDPDGSDGDHHENIEKRKFSYGQGMHGCWFGAVTFDAISGEIFDTILRCHRQDLFMEDWAEAKGRLASRPEARRAGPHPAATPSRRPVEMARRAAAMPADARKTRSAVHHHDRQAHHLRLISELESGTVIPPASLIPWLPAAEFERVISDAASRVLDVGVRRRLFTGATRRGIEVRDRQCYQPLLRRAVSHCPSRPHRRMVQRRPHHHRNGRMACGIPQPQPQHRPPPQPDVTTTRSDHPAGHDLDQELRGTPTPRGTRPVAIDPRSRRGEAARFRGAPLQVQTRTCFSSGR